MREQIITQISLGITSGDLKAGEKLPSTRELARRFQVHQNTISNAYRELAERALVEFKKGSGVYVRDQKKDSSSVVALEQLISVFLQKALAQGFTFNEITNNLQKRLSAKSQTHFLVIESDAELRKILVEEISDAIALPVRGISFDDLLDEREGDEAEVWLIFEATGNLQKPLPPHKNCFYLKANSVSGSMAGKERPSENELIAVVSGWEKFLTLAKMFLLAARIAPETLIVRSTGEANWRAGLPNASLIICDSAAAKEFSGDERSRIFRLIADSSLEKLRESIK